MNYESSSRVESKAHPGVTFVISKMSLGRRLDLIQRVRDLALKHEFVEAGGSPKERLEAAALSAEIDHLYVRWGVQQLIGLEVDGLPATPAMLASHGPEDLCQEAASAVKAECGLSEAERKN